MRTQTALILLPIEYNPDKRGKRRRIPIKDFQKTAVEISKIFDLGCTLDLYPKHGIWVKLGTVHKDVNVILEIDNLPKIEEKRLIKYCKEKLLRRFKQEAILINFIPQVQSRLVVIEKGGGYHGNSKKD